MLTSMRGRATGALVATGLAMSVAAACGSSSSSSTQAGNPTPTFDTKAPKTTATTAKGTATAACESKPLAEALAKAKADAKLGDYACSSTFAVATVEGPGLAQFGEAGFFTAGTDGQWVFVKTVPVDGTTLSSAPEGFPKAIYDQWLPSYQRPSRTSTTLCLFYDPTTKGCTDKPPPGYTGPGADTSSPGSGGNV